MKKLIWMFFHKIRVIFMVAYHAGKLIQQAKDRIAYFEVRAITHEQLDKFEAENRKQAGVEDVENIPDEHVQAAHVD